MAMETELNDPRLTRGEYWLLNHAVEAIWPLPFLTHPDPLAMFNHAGHGLSRDKLIGVLTDLFDRGWIVASRGAFRGKLSQGDLDEALNVAIPPPDARSEWNDDVATKYELTPEGGAIWEAFAAPDWSRYLEVCLVIPGEVCELTGATERFVQQYFSLVRHDNMLVKTETVEWGIVQPWQATYWKELPIGYRVRFEYTVAEDQTPRANWTPMDFLDSIPWYDWQ